MEPHFFGREPTTYLDLDSFTPEPLDLGDFTQEQLEALANIPFDKLPECVQNAYEEFATGRASLLVRSDWHPELETNGHGDRYAEAHRIHGNTHAPDYPSVPSLDEFEILEFSKRFSSHEPAPPIGSTAYGEPLLDITARF